MKDLNIRHRKKKLSRHSVQITFILNIWFIYLRLDYSWTIHSHTIFILLIIIIIINIIIIIIIIITVIETFIWNPLSIYLLFT